MPGIVKRYNGQKQKGLALDQEDYHYHVNVTIDIKRLSWPEGSNDAGGSGKPSVQGLPMIR